jgi:hypothetical protein
MRIWISIGLICTGLTVTFAQKGWEVGLMGGVSYYVGDLNTNYSLKSPGHYFSAVGRYNFNSRLSAKGGVGLSRVMANDQFSSNIYERARNLSFRSDIKEIGARIEFNFLPLIHGSKDAFFTPYLFTGLGIFSFNPEAELDGEWIYLQPLGTEGQDIDSEYRTNSANWQYGLGLKISLSYEWSVNIEVASNNTLTDYLDDVSTIYPDMLVLRRLRGPQAVELSDRSIDVPGIPASTIGGVGRQRGDSSNNDHYIQLSVGILYYFGQLRCPTISR